MGHALSPGLKLDSGINLNMSSLWLNMAPQWSLSRQMMVWAQQTWDCWKCCGLLQETQKTKKEKQKQRTPIHTLNKLYCPGFAALGLIPACIGLPDEDRKTHAYLQGMWHFPSSNPSVFELWEEGGAPVETTCKLHPEISLIKCVNCEPQIQRDGKEGGLWKNYETSHRGNRERLSAQEREGEWDQKYRNRQTTQKKKPHNVCCVAPELWTQIANTGAEHFI